MIHVPAMSKFMHHHTVQNLARHEPQKTVEIQIPVHSTASPSGRLKPDCNPTVSHADFLRLVRNPLRNNLFSLPFDFAYFFIRQKPHLLSRLNLTILFLNLLCYPLFFSQQKLLRRSFHSSIRSFERLT